MATKNWLRKKGIRGIEPLQLSVNITIICPKCKEIGNPVAEFVPQYVPVRDNQNPVDVRELVLFYNHKKGSKYERCRICMIENGRFFKPFKNSKIDLRDLKLGSVLRHILNKDKGYEKYARRF